MNDSHQALRRLIWLYFWLLLFEGALRKWLVPGLSNALLLVRDPLVVAIYALAFRDRLFPVSGFILWTIILAVLCFLASFAGIGNLAVTIYGLHANFLHLPLIFLMPRVLRPEDVRKMGYALLVVLLPMALLAIKQFQGGPTSAWNVGAGGEIGGQLYAAQGKVRASGTFSFVTGLASFLALSTAFLLDDLLGSRRYPRWLIYSALPALALALGVSGSRTAVLSVTIVCGVGMYVAFGRPAQMQAAARLVLLGLGVVLALSWLAPVFNEGLSVHRERFEGGGGVREGILVRYGEDFVAAARAIPTAPTLGLGLGVGTNVGASLLRGRREFSLGEGEWERIIFESGPILGLSYIALRLVMLLAIASAAYKFYRAGGILPLLLVGAGGLDLANGQFGQPTTLGFAAFTAGLALTAAGMEVVPEPARQPMAERPPVNLRGRSPYAERLHGHGETSNAP